MGCYRYRFFPRYLSGTSTNLFILKFNRDIIPACVEIITNKNELLTDKTNNSTPAELIFVLIRRKKFSAKYNACVNSE